MAGKFECSLETDNAAASNLSSLQLQPPLLLDDRQKIVLKQIEKVEQNFKFYEVVSVLFLLHKNAKKTYLDLEAFLTGIESNLISKWCREVCSYDDKWESRFYESLFLTKNYKILKQFDILSVNAVLKFNHNYFIPNLRLELHKICENIVGSEIKSLLTQMGDSEFRILKYADYLEINMLKWISDGKISVDGEINVGPLIHSLEAIDRHELAEKLQNYQQSCEPLKPQLENSKHLSEDYAIIDPNHVGLCVIINQETFKKDPQNPSLELKERKGTNKDCESLKKMLRTFKFDVEIVKDVISNEVTPVIRDKVVKFFKPHHSIFLLIILSHGQKGVIFGTDSKPVQISTIDCCLHLRELHGKPKIIIIQACQGDLFVKASKIETDAPVKEWPKDTLFCMATIPYFASYRHLEKGTWYIQTLCEIFQKHPEENIYSLLTKVNCELNNQPVFYTEEKFRSRPEFHSRLEKNLYFKRKQS